MNKIFISLILTILIAVFSYSIITSTITDYIVKYENNINYEKYYALSPSVDSQDSFTSEFIPIDNIKTDVEISTSDNRLIALRKFLSDKNSPMYPYADVIIAEADSNNLDWRLIVSISGVESNFGRIIPNGSYNAWGWKGDPTRDWSYFNNWKDGIRTVTRGLSYWYGNSLTPFQIEPAYCPPCAEDPNHSWANGVQYNMNLLNYYYNNLENK